MKISVYYTPESTPENEIPDCAVVIDVLRATTTIVTALNNGAKSVKAYSDLDLLTKESNLLPPESRLRLGERGGKKVDFCDLGNSPLDCTVETVSGKQLFISTTNGTRSLQRVQEAKTVIAGAMINFQAVVDYLQEKQPETLWLLGSGWEGGYSLEDTVCAGAIASLLVDTGKPDMIGNDEVIASIALYQQWQDKLLDLFKLSSHGQRLLRLALDDDLKYCSQKNITDTLPIQTSLGLVSLSN
ncbi:2-phosphosulfolactate phosphatase family protein [Cyanobacterium aponinum UTEX 3221]|uniref:2-phosphosulfolactate phosphatase family protein n=1 Tax=Cyanobacterium aponinum TaxID=379064 RepID=UPI002B4BD24A|nr:2-phosphosulfolactate phosphatase family protein [Cyanobacterium aponinum]WRL39443.1 2-phosphosulfolactate phosphatase family protein [Cyanobacterium aponinum UTEX 3221]